MGRIRSIKPEFFTSEQIVECSTSARLLFVGLWCFSDDAGRHPASVRRLKMEVFPGDTLTQQQVAAMVGELIEAGLLIEYTSQGQSYWEVTGWSKHQRVDRPTIKYPGQFDEGSTITRRAIDDDSPWSGVEWRGKERKKERGRKRPAVVFQKPSLEEIKAHCTARKNSIDPEAFFAFYESKGWKVGSQPMKDWKAAVVTWEKRASQNGQAKDDEVEVIR
jgi:hypothetical protein